MNQPVVFNDVLDAAEQLDPDAQAELVAILSHRLAERGRARVVKAVAEACQEFAAGQRQAMTAAEIISLAGREKMLLENALDALDRLFDRESSVVDV